MTRATLIFALGMCFLGLPTSHGQQRPGGKRTEIPPTALAREHLRELLLELQVTKTLAGAVSDRTVRDRLEQSIAKMDVHAKAMKAALDRLGAAPSASAAISAEDFARLLKSVKAQSFDDGRLNIVKDVVRHKHFTCAQAVDLVKLFSFSAGQKGAAIALHPRLVDPANFHEVLGAMTFDSDKAAVRKALGLSR